MILFVIFAALVDVDYLWNIDYESTDFSDGTSSTSAMINNANYVLATQLGSVGTVSSAGIVWHLSKDSVGGRQLRMNAYNVDINGISSGTTNDLSTYLSDSGGNLGTIPTSVTWELNSALELMQYTYTAGKYVSSIRFIHISLICV